MEEQTACKNRWVILQRAGSPKRAKRKCQRENNTVTEMNNAFDGPISKLDTGEKGISEFENM